MNDLVEAEAAKMVVRAKRVSKKAAAAAFMAEEIANVPIPTRVTLDPEAYKTIRSKLKSQREFWVESMSGSSGICYGGNISLKGTNWHQGHGACHAWIGRGFGWTAYGNQKAPESFLVLTCHSKKKATCSAEACDEIIRWMASDKSPFGKYIVNGDDEESLMNDGAMIYCGGTDGATLNECMWICKVLRYSTEGSKSLDTWLALYKEGVNPLLALLVATNMASVKGATFGFNAVTSHVSVFRTGDYYSANPKGGPNLLQLMAGEVNRKAASTGEVFGRDSKLAVIDKCESFVRASEKDDGWGGKIKSTGAEKQDLVANVLKWQAEIGGPVSPVFPFLSSSPPVVVPPPLPTKSTVFLEMDL
jgi:hypothetical protein